MDQSQGYIEAITVLINAGILIEQQIEGFVKFLSGGKSDAELNNILDAIYADAGIHKAIADKDLGKS